jgi:hypothetical protein
VNNTLPYIVLTGKDGYYVVHVDNRRHALAIFSHRSDAYADAECRSEAAYIDHMESQAVYPGNVMRGPI